MSGTEVKITSVTGSTFTVAGYGVVFGGQDVTGDYFAKDTDFWFDRVTHTPMVLYQHGQDGQLGRDVVGRVTAKQVDDIGLWVEAQIDSSKKYAAAIRKLIEKGVLGWSSGSVPHLVQRTKGTARGTTKIVSWPIVELSLTPTPAEPRTIGVRELKSLALTDPSLRAIAEDAIESNEGSLEDQIEDVREAASDLLGPCSVVATYPDYVIVSVYASDAPVYWRIPYTLDADGDPVLGKPEMQQMTFSPMSGKAPLSPDAGKIAPDSAVSTAWKGSPMHGLPDSAYAFIEPGGMLDEERKTVPRASRHHPHHDESGALDVESLKAALADPDLKSHGPVAHAHLLRHAKAAGLLEQKSVDDAHDSGWSQGGPAPLLVLAYEIVAAAEATIEDLKAMEHMGFDTKHGERWAAPRIKELIALQERFDQIVTKALETERGVDGAAVVQTFRTAFDLLDLEEVA